MTSTLIVLIRVETLNAFVNLDLQAMEVYVCVSAKVSTVEIGVVVCNNISCCMRIYVLLCWEFPSTYIDHLNICSEFEASGCLSGNNAI